MGIVVSDTSLSVPLAAVCYPVATDEKMHLHISAQLCCLFYKSRENACIWIAGYHTALNLSSRIMLLKILQPLGSGPADPLSPGAGVSGEDGGLSSTHSDLTWI